MARATASDPKPKGFKRNITQLIKRFYLIILHNTLKIRYIKMLQKALDERAFRMMMPIKKLVKRIYFLLTSFSSFDK
ncbi:hypothetical protein AAAC51_10860 [Priestia megaterium]